ncbi:KH domain-containing protein [Aphelenchoides fujianensis]|nr:KH domain-containing protein [Aphelenchoides fujianensis]
MDGVAKSLEAAEDAVAPPKNVTPFAARGDAKTVGTHSSPTGSADSKPKDETPPTSPDRSPADSPDHTAVVAALQRCSRAAAERRRQREEEAKRAEAVAEKRAEAVAEKLAQLNTAAAHPPAASTRRSRAPAPAGSAAQRWRSPKRELNGFVLPVRSLPSTNRPPTCSYCRQLIHELEELNRMIRRGSADFVPRHTSRLIAAEIRRIEEELTREEARRFARPLHDALDGVPVLETIGQTPLRVPSNLLPSVQHATPLPLLQAAEEASSSDNEGFVTATRRRRPQRSARRGGRKSSPPASPKMAAVDEKGEGELSTETAVEALDLDFTKPAPDAKKEESTEESDGSLPPATSKAAVYVPRPMRHGGRGGASGKSTAGLRSLLSPLERRGWTPPPAPRQTAAQPRRSPKAAARRAAPMGPIFETALPPLPLNVVVSNGVPNDLGMGVGRAPQPAHAMSARIYIPQVTGYNFIGRILGPRGISVRRLESETTCKILIRGRGSVKDGRRQERLMNKEGWEHLHDELHVLIAAFDDSKSRCRERLEYAVHAVQRLLIPQYDEYKRQQLMQLAIINGTYRP